MLLADGANAAEYDCVIEARQKVDIHNPVDAVIESVQVQRGDLVKKGQAIATLESVGGPPPNAPLNRAESAGLRAPPDPLQKSGKCDSACRSEGVTENPGKGRLARQPKAWSNCSSSFHVYLFFLEKLMAERIPADSTDPKSMEGTKIKWDDSNMKSAYANVCNVTSTREEVVMLFGVNQAWNRGQKEVTIQLTDRIIISPYAAKRLATLLEGVVKEYEKRFGVLNLEAPSAQQ